MHQKIRIWQVHVKSIQVNFIYGSERDIRFFRGRFNVEPQINKYRSRWSDKPSEEDRAFKALPHVTISSTISSTFHRRRWNIVDIVDDEPATRNDNVNDSDVK